METIDYGRPYDLMIGILNDQINDLATQIHFKRSLEQELEERIKLREFLEHEKSNRLATKKAS